MDDRSPRAAVVLGARNLGAALTTHLLARGANVATIARTRSDLDRLRAQGAVTIAADASDPDGLTAALERAGDEIGHPELIVNAVSPSRPAGDRTPFGGGPIATATTDGLDVWTVPVAQQTLVFLGAATRALGGRGGTLIQITGAPARRTNPQRGLVSGGMAAVRAFTHAAAQELRESGIHVALLIVDGIIESPKTAAMADRLPREALVRHEDVAHAVDFLATQSARGMTHELLLTPVGGRWVP
jgi:3-oxoacyl-[acyl-carrier protein] reductase